MWGALWRRLRASSLKQLPLLYSPHPLPSPTAQARPHDTHRQAAAAAGAAAAAAAAAKVRLVALVAEARQQVAAAAAASPRRDDRPRLKPTAATAAAAAMASSWSQRQSAAADPGLPPTILHRPTLAAAAELPALRGAGLQGSNGATPLTSARMAPAGPGLGAAGPGRPWG